MIGGGKNDGAGITGRGVVELVLASDCEAYGGARCRRPWCAHDEVGRRRRANRDRATGSCDAARRLVVGCQRLIAGRR